VEPGAGVGGRSGAWTMRDGASVGKNTHGITLDGEDGPLPLLPSAIAQRDQHEPCIEKE
jgi:hypothetical protein